MPTETWMELPAWEPSGRAQWPSPCTLPPRFPCLGCTSPSLNQCFQRMMMNRRALHNSPGARGGSEVCSVLCNLAPDLGEGAQSLPACHSGEYWAFTTDLGPTPVPRDQRAAGSGCRSQPRPPTPWLAGPGCTAAPSTGFPGSS